MITVLRSDSLREQLVHRAVSTGRNGSCLLSSFAAVSALQSVPPSAVFGWYTSKISDIASEVFMPESGCVVHSDLPIVVLSDGEERPETKALVLTSSAIIARADDLQSALSVLALDGHRTLCGMSIYNDEDHSVLSISAEVSGLRDILETIRADVSRMLGDAASASYAHLLSSLSAHEKSELLIESDTQGVRPRVYVDVLNQHTLEVLQRDLETRLGSNIDSASMRYASFVLALREGLRTGSLKVEDQNAVAIVDIGHSYNLALFMFGVRDVAGNESVDLHVEMPVLDYEQPRVFVNMKSVTGCADKRALAASWIKDTYGDRLLSALANVTCTPAMSDETLRSRVWDALDARMLLFLCTLVENQERARVAVARQAQALENASSALRLSAYAG